jgi:CubicO group peptidase (beta-lactamase class C family)
MTFSPHSRHLFHLFIFLLAGLHSVTAMSVEMLADPPWFRDILEQYRQQYNLPALGASVIINGQVVAASVVGIRKYGDKTPAEQDDRFHIGSIAKPITATLLARFIEQGFFHWQDTIETMFPDLVDNMQPVYRKVNIEQLLSHTSGMPYQPTTPESETDKFGNTAQLKRKGYVIAALKDKPEAPPGTKFIYGGGHILAAHYAEVFMELPYEELMREQVFVPLGMTTARFGPPATPGKIDAPWEHVIENGVVKPLAPEQDQFEQARSPAGRNLCMSIADLGRFAATHLSGAQAKSNYLKPETFTYLHTPVPSSTSGPSWGIGKVNWADGNVLWHSGSTLKNFALCHIVPEENFAMCLVTNIWYEGIHQNMDKLTIDIARFIQGGHF